jgi:hypothetical protein
MTAEDRGSVLVRMIVIAVGAPTGVPIFQASTAWLAVVAAASAVHE